MIAYIGDCIHLNEDFIHKLQDNWKSISYRIFIKKVPRSELIHLFPIYDWNKPGLHIQDDYAVSFFQCTLKCMDKSKVVYYICKQSGIEYIWREI